MEQIKANSQLEELKKLHKFDTYRPFMGTETIGRGENLDQMLISLSQLCASIKAYTEYTHTQYKEAYTKACDFFKSQGISLIEYSGKSRKETTPAYLNQYIEKLRAKYIYNDYSDLYAITQLESLIKKGLEYSSKSEREKALTDSARSNREAIFNLATAFLSEAEITIAQSMGATTSQIEELIKQKYIDSKNGETMDCSCDECSTYIIGEHRCCCGNRRISVEAEFCYSNGTAEIYMTSEPY